MGYPVYNFTMERVMKHEYDVLVIGGGMSGVSAAVSAAKRGQRRSHCARRCPKSFLDPLRSGSSLTVRQADIF